MATETTLDLDTALGVLDAACAGGQHEEILLGIFLVARFRKALPQLPWTRILRWLAEVDNWETCDQLATSIAAPAVAANDALLPKLQALARQRNLWARRFALSVAVGLNQRGRHQTPACLAIAALLMTDAEPMVQKALALALRQASKVDAAPRNARGGGEAVRRAAPEPC